MISVAGGNFDSFTKLIQEALEQEAQRMLEESKRRQPYVEDPLSGIRMRFPSLDFGDAIEMQKGSDGVWAPKKKRGK